MWSKEIKIITGFLAIAVFQIAWHWFLSTHTGLAETLLRAYLHYNPRTGKGVSGWADLVLPAVPLGLFVGRVGWQWPIWKLSCFVVLFAAGLVALDYVYIVFLNKEQVWWWPKTDNDAVAFFVRNTIQTIILLGVFTYGGRGWGAYSRGEGKDVWSKDQVEQKQDVDSQKSSGVPPKR
jgi:hypothetical protein